MRRREWFLAAAAAAVVLGCQPADLETTAARFHSASASAATTFTMISAESKRQIGDEARWQVWQAAMPCDPPSSVKRLGEETDKERRRWGRYSLTRTCRHAEGRWMDAFSLRGAPDVGVDVIECTNIETETWTFEDGAWKVVKLSQTPHLAMKMFEEGANDSAKTAAGAWIANDPYAAEARSVFHFASDRQAGSWTATAKRGTRPTLTPAQVQSMLAPNPESSWGRFTAVTMTGDLTEARKLFEAIPANDCGREGAMSNLVDRLPPVDALAFLAKMPVNGHTLLRRVEKLGEAKRYREAAAVLEKESLAIQSVLDGDVSWVAATSSSLGEICLLGGDRRCAKLWLDFAKRTDATHTDVRALADKLGR